MAKAPAKKDKDQLPAFMQDDVGKGTEDIGRDAMEVPRLKLLQATSSELDADETLRKGHWFHTIIEESLGTEMPFIPCYSTLSYMLWRPQNDGGGILARADDGVHWNPPNAEFKVKLKKSASDEGKEVIWRTKPTVAASRLDQFGTEDPDDPNSHPAAVSMINVAGLCPDRLDLGPFVVTFQRSGFKVGKKFMSNLKLSRVPSFGRVFTVYSATVDGAEGPYLEPRLKATGLVDDEDLYNQAKGTYETFKELGLRVSEETMAEDAASEATSGPGADEEDY